jgi:predicted ATP-grasp superfamily ATP-dependent carboligase
MSRRGSSLKNTTIVCIGFNCRPIAEYCAAAGFKPIVIDFFGDMDIRPHVTGGHYYLETSGGSHDADRFRSWAMDTLKDVAKQSIEKPCIFPGSGFDDDIDAWTLFNDVGLVLGNAPASVVKARDLNLISAILQDNSIAIEVPKTLRFSISAGADMAAISSRVEQSMNYPFLAKRSRTAGGAGIDLLRGRPDLDALLGGIHGDLLANPAKQLVYSFQEFVGGHGARDASLIAMNESVVCKTSQVIGDSTLHAPKRFSYCGNSIPLVLEDTRFDNVADMLATALHRDIGLKGLYGIDLVLSQGKIFLVEINPRVPGSTELASMALDRNLFADHVHYFVQSREPRQSRQSLQQVIKTSSDPFKPRYHAIKQILFSGKVFTMPSLDGMALHGSLHDITPPGTHVPGGMPILTYILRGSLNTRTHNEAVARQEIEALYANLNKD